VKFSIVIGNQYTSSAFREELRNMVVIQSMNSIHHCYDNARIEIFCDAEEGKAVPDSDASDDEGRSPDGNFPICVWPSEHDSDHKLQF
jgi:hypothetical protein